MELESYLDGFEVAPKHSSEEALANWRKLCVMVKNPKRRFRFTANLSKRSEATAMHRTNQEKLMIAVRVSKAAFQFMQGMQPSDYTVPEEVKAAGFQNSADELGSIVEGNDVTKLKFNGVVAGIGEKISTSTTSGLTTDSSLLNCRQETESEGRGFLVFVLEGLFLTPMILGECAFVSLILGIAMEGWPKGAHDGLGIVASILLVVFVTATSEYCQYLQFKDLGKEIKKKILLILVLICLNLVRVAALELQLTILEQRMDHVLNCMKELFGAESVYTEQKEVTNQVKMLTAVLKFMVDATAMGLFLAPPSDDFDVAKNLVDLIILIELYLGSGYAALLVAAVKTWLPYLILALVSLSLQGAIGKWLRFTLSVALLSSNHYR